jgi:hypothetical protein
LAPVRACPILLLAAGACAQTPRGPYFDDERYLVVGVDPGREVDAVTGNLERAGYRIGPRFSGRHFAAIGFADAAGLPLGVRVITGRGIALALDPIEGDVFTPALRHRLLEAPLIEQHDADGDGFEEVFVERIEGPVPERCVQAFRVRDSGFVDAVSAGVALAGVARRDEPLWLDPFFCTQGQVPAGDAAVETTDAAPPAEPGSPPSP